MSNPQANTNRPKHTNWLQRFIIVTLIAIVTLPAVILTSADTADAQQTCTEGTLSDGWCEIDSAPFDGVVGCPNLQDGGQCYTLVQPLGAGPGNPGVCPPNTQPDPDLTPKVCRRSEDPVVGSPTCAADSTLEVDRCVKRTAPTCGPLGCDGRVIVNYTVNCVGEGVARVDLGTPQLINGAVITLITVNGSAVVGADIAGGSGVAVQVTTTSSADDIEINGPAVAPTCVTSTPVPTATTAPTPAPATPTPPTPAAPEPTATPEPEATTEPSTETTAPTPTATPTVTAEEGAEVTELAPTPQPTSDLAQAKQACDAPAARIGGQCLLPCPTATGLCYELTQGVATAIQMPEPVAQASSDNSLVIILAAIAGASVVLSVASFSALARRHPRS